MYGLHSPKIHSPWLSSMASLGCYTGSQRAQQFQDGPETQGRPIRSSLPGFCILNKVIHPAYGVLEEWTIRSCCLDPQNTSGSRTSQSPSLHLFLHISDISQVALINSFLGKLIGHVRLFTTKDATQDRNLQGVAFLPSTLPFDLDLKIKEIPAQTTFPNWKLVLSGGILKAESRANTPLTHPDALQWVQFSGPRWISYQGPKRCHKGDHQTTA